MKKATIEHFKLKRTNQTYLGKKYGQTYDYKFAKSSWVVNEDALIYVFVNIVKWAENQIDWLKNKH
jgi:hypothetical protein